MITAQQAYDLTVHFNKTVNEIDILIIQACNEGKFMIQIKDDKLLGNIEKCFHQIAAHYNIAGFWFDWNMSHNSIWWDKGIIEKIK